MAEAEPPPVPALPSLPDGSWLPPHAVGHGLPEDRLWMGSGHIFHQFVPLEAAHKLFLLRCQGDAAPSAVSRPPKDSQPPRWRALCHRAFPRNAAGNGSCLCSPTSRHCLLGCLCHVALENQRRLPDSQTRTTRRCQASECSLKPTCAV